MRFPEYVRERRNIGIHLQLMFFRWWDRHRRRCSVELQVLWILGQTSLCKLHHFTQMGNPCPLPGLDTDAEYNQNDDTNNDESTNSSKNSLRCCVKHVTAICHIIDCGTVSADTDLGLAGIVGHYARQSTSGVICSVPFPKESKL